MGKDDNKCWGFMTAKVGKIGYNTREGKIRIMTK